MNRKEENIKNENVGFDWKGQFPDVPKQVHQSVVNTLEQLEEKKKTVSFRKKRMVLAAALVALIGTTAAAAEYVQWHERAVSDLHNPSQKIQNKFTDLELASNPETTVTLEGVTVTLEQVIQDENTLYFLLKLTAEEPIIGGWGFRHWQLWTEDGKLLTLMPSHQYTAFYNDTPDGAGWTKEGYMSLIYGSDDIGKLDYERLVLCLIDYDYDRNYLPVESSKASTGTIRGRWELPVTLNPEAAKQLTKVYETDVEVPLYAKPYTVKEVTITPFSIDMLVEASDDEEKIQEYAEKYGSWDNIEDLYARGFRGVKYADGTIVDLSRKYSGGMSTSYEKGKQAHWHVYFNIPLDSENVTALLFGENGEICIELP